jgi:hypothetical protein
MQALSCGGELLMLNIKQPPPIFFVVVLRMIDPFGKGCFGLLKQLKWGLDGVWVIVGE